MRLWGVCMDLVMKIRGVILSLLVLFVLVGCEPSVTEEELSRASEEVRFRLIDKTYMGDSLYQFTFIDDTNGDLIVSIMYSSTNGDAGLYSERIEAGEVEE